MQIAIQLGKPDRDGKQTVVAKHSGIEEVKHVDHINTLDAYRRKTFAEFFGAKVLANSPYCSGGSYEQQIADIVLAVDAEIVRKAEEAAEQDGEASDWEPAFRFMSDIESQTLEWLQPGIIPLGKPTGINGNPGDGKSVLLCDYASRVSTGAPWPNDRQTRNEPGGVVILSAEDDPEDTIKPRLQAAGADCSKIIIIDAMKMTEADGTEHVRCVDLSKDIARVEQALEAMRAKGITPKLLTIDPITAYMGDGTDSHKNAEVRTFLAAIAALAAKWNIAIVMVNHLNKGAGSALYRTQGSIAFVAAVRAAWLLCRDKADPRGARRLFLPLKSNLSKDSEGWGFVLSSEHSSNGQPICEWEAEPVKTSADDALAVEPRKKGPKSEDLPEAVEFLRKALANGPRPTKDVEAEAKGNGISLRTLKRARNELGTIASRPVVPGPWYLELRQGDQVLGPVASPLGTLGPLGPLGTVASFPDQTNNKYQNVCIEDQEGQVDEYREQDDDASDYGHLEPQEF